MCLCLFCYQADETQYHSVSATINKALKVIWEDSHVAALSHIYAIKVKLVTMACPKFAPKNNPSPGPITKPYYLPHPWTL